MFAFDLRRHGFSEGRHNHRRAAADLAAAVRAVRALGARKVVVIGASLGGIATLVAAPSLTPALAGVVSVSGPAAIAGQLNALPVVPTIRVPDALRRRGGRPEPAVRLRRRCAGAVRRVCHEREAPRGRPGSLHGTFLVDGSSAVRALLRSPSATRLRRALLTNYATATVSGPRRAGRSSMRSKVSPKISPRTCSTRGTPAGSRAGSRWPCRAARCARS